MDTQAAFIAQRLSVAATTNRVFCVKSAQGVSYPLRLQGNIAVICRSLADSADYSPGTSVCCDVSLHIGCSERNTAQNRATTENASNRSIQGFFFTVEAFLLLFI